MVIAKKLFPLVVVAALLSGCSSSITNLSPNRAHRNADNLVTLEAAFSSGQQSLVWSSIKPSVMVGQQLYPMRPTPLMTNRWETVVPLPKNEKVMDYRYKFDFQYLSFGTPPKSDSQLSRMYRLQILDK